MKELKIYNPEETKKKILSMMTIEGNKDSLLAELGEELIPAHLNAKKKDKDETWNKLQGKATELFRIYESETHVGLMESFGKEYRMLSVEMCKDITQELNCSSESEKALVELIVNAFIRVIDNSKRLNCLLNSENISPNKNVYIANLSKQIDRAHRQFISALMTLKQLKSPMVEMNIKATTAFISQNQQINADKKINEG